MKRARKQTMEQMYRQRLTKSLQMSIAVVIPLMALSMGLLVRAGIFNASFYVGDEAFVLIMVGLFFASVLYVYVCNYTNDRLGFFASLAMFHIFCLMFIVDVAGFATAFLTAWIPLIIGTELLFGTVGLFISVAWLGLAGGIFILSYPSIASTDQLLVVQATIAVGVVGYVLTNVRRIMGRETEALAALREHELFQRERLLALINSMGDAVITTDDKGKIKVFNAALLALLDTNTSPRGKQIDEVLRLHDTKRRRVSIIADANAVGRIFSRTDLTHTFRGGEKMRLYVNIAPIRPGYQSKGEHGYIFIMRDITKEKTLDDERDEFISVVSHELRTPIAIAEGNLSNLKMLQAQKADPTLLAHAVNDAHEQITFLAKMVNDLSTLSRAERGINDGGLETVDIKAFISEQYAKYMPRAQAKHLQLDLDLDSTLPRVQTSRLYLEEILQNFITNAIKYTTKGNVTISAHRVPKGLRIAVRDSGIGISKSDQRHMFEKFYRSEDYRTRATSGTGLGLYISKKLADKMGIAISFESRLNHGSTFSVTITI